MANNKRQNTTDNCVVEAVKILSSLSNIDAMRIFIEAKEGIQSSTKAIKKLDMTQKRYYVWLKKLMEAGLIEKWENIYIQTMLGKFFSKLGRSIVKVLGQRGQFELADKLMKVDLLSAKEKEEFLSMISKKNLLENARLSDIIHDVKMITDYDQYMNEIKNMLENSKKCIHYAVQRIDVKVIDLILSTINRGIKFSILSTAYGLSEDIHPLKLILSSGSADAFREWFNSNKINLRLTDELSYSFVIADVMDGVIELSHPKINTDNPIKFSVGFRFKNPVFCQQLVDTFNFIYKNGTEARRLNYLRKYLS